MEGQQLKTEDRKWDIVFKIRLANDWPTARQHTCDRRRSVVGLTDIFPDFFPWLFCTKGLSDACKSSLTLVSPTHNARYLLKYKHAVDVSNKRIKHFHKGLASITDLLRDLISNYRTDKIKRWQLTANPCLEVYLKSIFCQFPVIKKATVMYNYYHYWLIFLVVWSIKCQIVKL